VCVEKRFAFMEKFCIQSDGIRAAYQQNLDNTMLYRMYKNSVDDSMDNGANRGLSISET